MTEGAYAGEPGAENELRDRIPAEPTPPAPEPEPPAAPLVPPAEPPAPTERPERLERAKLMPIEGVIYCLDHEAVHDADDLDCDKADHRPVLYRARKGDLDPTLGDEEAVQTRVMAAENDVLPDAEKGVLAGLVRVQIRKVTRNKRGAKKLFGDEYDPSKHDAKLALLESAYRGLGGDPERITGRGGED